MSIPSRFLALTLFSNLPLSRRMASNSSSGFNTNGTLSPSSGGVYKDDEENRCTTSSRRERCIGLRLNLWRSDPSTFRSEAAELTDAKWTLLKQFPQIWVVICRTKFLEPNLIHASIISKQSNKVGKRQLIINVCSLFSTISSTSRQT